MAVRAVNFVRSLTDDTVILGLQIDQFEEIATKEVFERIVEITAEKYVSENYAEIAKSLDPRAIGTLALARSAQFIAESISTSKIAEATAKLETMVKEVLERQRRI